jgi:hypothetical protein
MFTADFENPGDNFVAGKLLYFEQYSILPREQQETI